MPASASPNAPAQRGAFVDPQALMRIRNLELRARVVVEGFWTGLHRSPYHGFSVEFTEYRQYAAGDDLRYLDWRVLGRSDRYFIKRYEDETNLRCHLVVDQSRSMSYSSIGHTKAEYAATLAATFAWFLHRQGDATGLLTFDDQIREYLPARSRAGHLRQLLLALEKPAEGRVTDLATPLRRVAEILRKRGLILLVSDLLAPVEKLEAQLTVLVASGHEVALFQILDPAEVSLQFDQPAWFEDLESGRTVFVDPTASRTRYQERLEEHTRALQAMCQRLGVGWQRVVTSEPLEHALFEFLRSRAQARRGRARFAPVAAPGAGGSRSRA